MPLKSLRILDLSRLLPGPYCSMFFADFGAEVIKIEEPKIGDYARWAEPKFGDNSAVFESINRNKKSIALNLRSDKGKEIFSKLVETADVVLETFRPGVMDRLGLGYQELRKINPKIIYCSITGYGQGGPYAQKAGHDINYLSFAGLLGLQGDAKGPPVLSATQIADIGGGSLMAVIGILIALQARNQSGEGQFVDISMTDGVVSWMNAIYAGYFVNKDLPERGKLALSGGRASYYVYETADTRYLSVGAYEEKFWQVFCNEIGVPHLIEHLKAPFEKQQEMINEISAVIKSKTLKEWMGIFKDKDSCVSPVLNIDEVLDDPQIKGRKVIIDYELPQGNMKHIRNPVCLSETPAFIHSKAPSLGEHNVDVFTGIGYSLNDIEGWIQNKII